MSAQPIRIVPRGDWRKLHWPAARDTHDCADPYCPQKVCRVCGHQIRDCVERQKELAR